MFCSVIVWWLALASAHAQSLPPSSPWLGLLRPRQGAFGVEAVEVFEDSGAAAAGIASGDEILFVDGLPVSSVTELQLAISRHRVGELAEVRVMRRGVELTFKVTLGAQVDDRELVHRRLVGKAAPPALLQLVTEGREFDPSALRGQVVVLAWFSTRCDGCGALISQLAQQSWISKEAVLAAVTSAEPDRVASYLSRQAISAPVAVAEPEAFDEYCLLPRRGDTAVAFVVIDRSGVVRVAAVIDTATGARALEEPQATVDDVATAIRGLLRGRRR